MILLRPDPFIKLQGNRNEEEMSKALGVTRTQLWRIKTGATSIGVKFITNFKLAFPDAVFEDYFLCIPGPKQKAG